MCFQQECCDIRDELLVSFLRVCVEGCICLCVCVGGGGVECGVICVVVRTHMGLPCNKKNTRVNLQLLCRLSSSSVRYV